MSEPILEVDDLTVQYRTSDGWLTAVSDASFSIDRGSHFGLVGESGCGKSTMAKAILSGLDDNARIQSGAIRYDGEEIQDLDERALTEQLRWTDISWIPQGSMNSLDPLMKVSEQALNIARAHTDLSKQEAMERFREMFEVVGLQESRISDYPHQFSGGMMQRALIALSLFLDPDLIIADEPTTALDVILQDQIFKYLEQIKEQTDTSMMLITHDISLVFESCDDMAIMHGGQVAETGDVTELYDDPRHPYAILLQEAFPDVRHPDETLEIIEGRPPQSFGEVNHCTFVERCPWAVEECRESAPDLEPIQADGSAGEAGGAGGAGGAAAEGGDTPHQASCFRKDEVLELYRAEGKPELAQGSRRAEHVE